MVQKEARSPRGGGEEEIHVIVGIQVRDDDPFDRILSREDSGGRGYIRERIVPVVPDQCGFGGPADNRQIQIHLVVEIDGTYVHGKVTGSAGRIQTAAGRLQLEVEVSQPTKCSQTRPVAQDEIQLPIPVEIPGLGASHVERGRQTRFLAVDTFLVFVDSRAQNEIEISVPVQILQGDRRRSLDLLETRASGGFFPSYGDLVGVHFGEERRVGQKRRVPGPLHIGRGGARPQLPLVDLHKGLIRGLRLLGLVLLLIKVEELEERGRVMGIYADGFPEALLGLIDSIEPFERHTQVVVSGGAKGIEAEEVAELGRGLDVLPGSEIHDAQKIGRMRGFRFRFLHGLESGDGRIVFLGQRQAQSQIEPVLDRRGGVFHGLLKMGGCTGEILVPELGGAEVSY